MPSNRSLRSCSSRLFTRAQMADGTLGQHPQGYRLTESGQLEALGQKIDALRKELAILEKFWFHARFRHYCSIKGSSAVGEPKLAK